MSMFNKISETIRMKMFMTESFIINWSNYDKSIFILLLGGLNTFGIFNWYSATYAVPETRQWLNEAYFPYRFASLIIIFCIYLISIILSYLYRHHRLFQKIIPYYAPMFFGACMIYSGYTIGIYNPATISGYISIVLVGLVLYDRKIVYCVVIPVTVYIGVVCYLTTMHNLPYAPLFSDKLNLSVLYKNKFWVVSMALLYLPIMAASILLFELLLWQWRNREQEYEVFSKTDSLTSVFNRRHIDDELRKLQRKQNEYALVLLDLDHFKNINDNYGHGVGDRVLKRVAEVLALNVRQDDVVGRFGGEEFLLILRHKNMDQAMEIAERCRKQIEQEIIMISEAESLTVSASFGVTVSSNNLSDDVMKQADQALYLAKASGRNQVQSFDLVMNHST